MGTCIMDGAAPGASAPLECVLTYERECGSVTKLEASPKADETGTPCGGTGGTGCMTIGDIAGESVGCIVGDMGGGATP